MSETPDTAGEDLVCARCGRRRSRDRTNHEARLRFPTRLVECRDRRSCQRARKKPKP